MTFVISIGICGVVCLGNLIVPELNFAAHILSVVVIVE